MLRGNAADISGAPVLVSRSRWSFLHRKNV